MVNQPDRASSSGQRAFWGAVGLVVLLAAVQYSATYAILRPWSWRQEMLITITWWCAWLPLVPVVDRVARRFNFGPGKAFASTLAHAAAASVLSLAHLAAVSATALFAYVPVTPKATWFEIYARFLGMPFLVFDVATYIGVAATVLAARYARAYREEELLAERLAARASALEALVAEAKLETLRMELNPHFLFNALNAVAGLVGEHRNDDAREMLGRLGALLRRTLNRDRAQFSDVVKEIELAQDFLYIEQVRFGNRLHVRVTIDEAARDASLPSMLLQPLVENAVRHGIEPAMRDGEISIEVHRVRDELIVRIEDTGRGFLSIGGNRPREGIGLTNTRARLRELYGGRASLHIGNVNGSGGRVEIRMPAAPPDVSGIAANAQG